MICERVRSLLLLHLSDDLEPPEESLVSAHLEDCRDCRESHEGYSRIFGAFGSLPGVEVPPRALQGVAGAVLDRLESEGIVHKGPVRARTMSGTHRMIAGVAAACIVLGCFLVGWALEGRPGDPETSGNTDLARPDSLPPRPVPVVETSPRDGDGEKETGRSPVYALTNGSIEKRQKAGGRGYVQVVHEGRGVEKHSTKYEIGVFRAPRTGTKQVDF